MYRNFYSRKYRREDAILSEKLYETHKTILYTVCKLMLTRIPIYQSIQYRRIMYMNYIHMHSNIVLWKNSKDKGQCWEEKLKKHL